LINILTEKLGIDGIWFDDAISGDPPQYWLTFTHPLRRAIVRTDKMAFGGVGEINQTILDALGIKEQISFFELNLPDLVGLATEERAYRPPSKYPAIIRDLAISVEQTTKIESVLNIIETAGGELLQDTDIFDIYEGLAGNKKSLAFRLIYQSDERNLTDEEVNKLQEKIIKAIEEEGWEVRR